MNAPMTFEGSQLLVRVDAKLADAIRKVAEIDLAMISIAVSERNGWTTERCAEVEGLYRKFLALNIRYPDRKVCPTGPIDAFWHAHMLDTRAYAADCEHLFGEMLHHFPYFGMRGADDRAALEKAFSESIDLFIIHFGVDPTAGDSQARSCRPQRCP